MRQIRILETNVANQIAAGEVIERPASVIKELAENSLDAGSTSITIEIQGGGIEYMRVTDNGGGISYDDAAVAFERHATSKLATAEDLTHIETLGFRGEALASIASVSKVTMKTQTEDSGAGAQVVIEGGKLLDHSQCGCPNGTSIEVKNLFYNVPARLKFLKSARSESGHIADYAARLIMARPDVSFKLVQDSKVLYHSAGDNSLINAIYTVYGAAIVPNLREVRFDDGYMFITGFVGDESVSQSNRNRQSFYINNRYIKSAKLSFAIQRAFDTRIMRGRFPFAVLKMQMSSKDIDVNVHPNKLDVRFKDELRVTGSIVRAVMAAISGKRNIDPIAGKADIANAADKFEQETAKSIWPVIDTIENVERHTHNKETLKNNDGAIWTPALSEGPYSGDRPVNGRIKVREGRGKPHDNDLVVMPNSASINGGILKEQETEQFTQNSYMPPTPKTDPVCEKTNPSLTITQEKIDLDIGRFKVLDCAFNAYWIVEQDNDLYLIDQHAAHERRLYEELISDKLRLQSQMLLTPQIVKFAPREFDTIMENLDDLTAMGFDIEEFGAFTVSVRAVPYMFDGPQSVNFLKEAADIFINQSKATAADLKRSAIIQLSCKLAIKAGQCVDRSEILELLSYFAKDGAPLTCPHGRPVVVRLSKREIEKMFKRVL